MELGNNISEESLRGRNGPNIQNISKISGAAIRIEEGKVKFRGSQVQISSAHKEMESLLRDYRVNDSLLISGTYLFCMCNIKNIS